MTTEDVVLSIVIGVITGIATSALWIGVLYQIKPKIDIAAAISVTPKHQKYFITVTNRRKSAALNVKAQLLLITPIKAQFNNSMSIPLKRSELFQLSGRNRKHAGAAQFRFIIEANLDDLRAKYPKSHLAFRLYATHPVTQFGRLYKRDYQWIEIKNEAANDLPEELL